MSNFNFGFNDNFEVKETGDYLKGGEIHSGIKVVVKASETKNSKDASIVYTTIDFEFSNDAGAVYNHKIFEPNAQSGTRNTSPKGFPMPSSWEYDKFVIGHILSIYAPKTLEKLQKANPKSFKEYAKLVESALATAKDVKTNLKLILNKDKWARLPFCVSINKAGEAFLSAPFLGEELAFSSYELDSIKKINDAVPTSVASKKDSEETEDEEDVDLENITFDDEEL